MSTRDEVLAVLEKNRGNAVSGSMLAKKLNITRTAVWKAVDTLRSEGYVIDSLTKRGYILDESNDILSKSEILQNLNCKEYYKNMFVYKEIDSTNTKAKALVHDGTNTAFAVLAEHQTAGRGRLGRQFFSPESNGLYLSACVSTDFSIEVSSLVTAAAAVAVCRALKKLFNVEGAIKWVNDIYVNNKKLCGILTEAILNMETSRFNEIIIGIGINVRKSTLPSDIKDIVISLEEITDQKINRNVLAAAVLDELYNVITNLDTKEFLDEYKKRCFVIGQEINVISPSCTYPATAIDIDDDAHLIVKNNDGETIILNSGEISVRLKRQ